MVYTGINNYLLGTNDITKLTSGQVDSLDIGNAVILNEDSEQKTFVVSKKTASEIVLTYNSKSEIVEVKYAWEDGAWAFDEKTTQDIMTDEMVEEKAVEAVEGAETGTLANALGLDSNGKLVKGAIAGGGVKLYCALLRCNIKFYDETSNSVKTNSRVPIYLIVASGGTPTISGSSTSLGITNGVVIGSFYEKSQLFGSTYLSNIKIHNISNVLNQVNKNSEFRIRAVIYKTDGTLYSEYFDMITGLNEVQSLVEII